MASKFTSLVITSLQTITPTSMQHFWEPLLSQLAMKISDSQTSDSLADCEGLCDRAINHAAMHSVSSQMLYLAFKLPTCGLLKSHAGINSHEY